MRKLLIICLIMLGVGPFNCADTHNKEKLAISIEHVMPDCPDLKYKSGELVNPCLNDEHWATIVDRKALSADELQKLLLAEAKLDRVTPGDTQSLSNRIALIAPDASAPWHFVVGVIEACAKAHIEKIELGAEKIPIYLRKDNDSNEIEGEVRVSLISKPISPLSPALMINQEKFKDWDDFQATMQLAASYAKENKVPVRIDPSSNVPFQTVFKALKIIRQCDENTPIEFVIALPRSAGDEKPDNKSPLKDEISKKESIEEPAPKALSDNEKLVTGHSTFGLDLYARLSEQKDNLIFSPYSISTALAMAYAGARGNTEKQMANVLHFALPQGKLHPALGKMSEELMSQKDFQLHIVNALWGQKGFGGRKAFLDIVHSNYRAECWEVDFQNNLNQINEDIHKWIAQQTQGKITAIEEIRKPNVGLVLINAIYFEAGWAYRFYKEETADGNFHLLGNKTIAVPMMYQEHNFKYYSNWSFQMLELPYLNQKTSMIIFLPKRIDGIKEFESLFTIGNLNIWMSKLEENKVNVSLPRFKLTSNLGLNQALMSLGMTDAFSPKNADLTGISDKVPIWIDRVLHNALIEVDENGTIASAMTKIEMTFDRSNRFFRVDHPFVFIIRDNSTNSILFMGRVMNPITN